MTKYILRQPKPVQPQKSSRSPRPKPISWLPWVATIKPERFVGWTLNGKAYFSGRNAFYQLTYRA
jgi:hypothetical protein